MVLSVLRVTQLKEFQKQLSFEFKDLNLLNKAFTHKSYAKENRNNEAQDNERLEFLGDAVLKLVISEYLYSHFPDKDEGYLTKIRANVISDSTLATVANQHSLGRHLLLSKNELQNGGDTRKSNVANALEALFGACYLDGGIEPAKKIILKFMQPTIHSSTESGETNDYKSMLQEKLQARGWKLPEYRVIQELGPEHEKTFHVQVRAGRGLRKLRDEGTGRTKKEAEQHAAAKILKQLGS